MYNTISTPEKLVGASATCHVLGSYSDLDSTVHSAYYEYEMPWETIFPTLLTL